MEFKSGCSSCGEAWLGPSGLGEKACDPMRSSSCNPFWWNSTCAGERLGSGCWRNVWKIWCGAYWFCFDCPGTSIHVKFLARYHVEWHEAWSMVIIWLEIELNTYTHRHKYKLTLTHRRIFWDYTHHCLSKEITEVSIMAADNWCNTLGQFFIMILELKNGWVKMNTAWVDNGVILFIILWTNFCIIDPTIFWPSNNRAVLNTLTGHMLCLLVKFSLRQSLKPFSICGLTNIHKLWQFILTFSLTFHSLPGWLFCREWVILELLLWCL